MEIQRRENARIHVSRFLSRSLSLRENDSRRNPPINTFSFRSFDTTCLPSSKSAERVTEPASSLPKEENISLTEPQEEKIDTRVGVVGESLPINNSSTSSSSSTSTSKTTTIITTTTNTTATTTTTTTTSSSIPRATTDQGSNEKQAVGEWNSLPVLVERLRSVLELSLAIADTSSSSSSPIKEDSRGLALDVDDSRKVRPMDERSTAVKNNNGKEQDLKNDLRFLEDLLMSDIHTALSRLRETLERIDVGALAKHGAASDPTSKLQLLRLVSSLLSRLEMPRDSLEEENKILSQEEKLKSSLTTTTSSMNNRRRRGSRHTIGVSAEELACARKWLQEEKNFKEVTPFTKITPSPMFTTTSTKATDSSEEKPRPEEIHDKYTKDAINHRQSLRDKNNIDKGLEIRPRAVVPFYADKTDFVVSQTTNASNEVTHHQSLRPSIDSRNKLDNTEVGNVEVGRVGRLAAALQQRVESSSKCTSSNRFIAKKSKIKRANTIDIPSYLKLQADSLKQEGSGCVSLKKPINVSDKANCSSIKNMIVPSFQPKTENDRKFMALINKNNDTPIFNAPTSFKSFGYTKTMDPSTVSNENWNSRFSNIKTAFDKTTTSGDDSEQQVNKNKLPKRPPIVPQVTQRYNPGKEKPFNPNVFCNFEHDTPNAGQSISPGFRHAPSSPFRRIEKPTIVSNFVKPLPIPTNPAKSNIPMPGNTLREKARKMFDRGDNSNNVQQRALEYKVQVDGNSERRTFPRPPWIEHEKSSSVTIAENGRLDYRSFCKQFAPFVSKGTSSSSLEKTPYEFNNTPQQNSKVYQPRNELISEQNHPNVVDGKISFQMIPKDYNHYNIQGTRDSRDFTSETETTGGSQQADVTLRGSASVAVQTGVQDEITNDEARSFRVTPKISNGPPLICSNVSIQTSSDVPSTISEDVQNFLSDNQKNHNEEKSREEYRSRNESDSVLPIKENVREAVPFHDYCSKTIVQNPQMQNQIALVTIYDEPVPKTEQNEYESAKVNYAEDDRSQSKDYDYLDAKNIQNQDISEEEGVVTRYTCAIATVANVENPNIQEEIVEPSYFKEYSTPSVSPVSRSKTNNDEEVDEEIRRHNMLQQSLIQRLHHERCTMIDRPFKRSPIDYQNETHENSKKEQQTFEQGYYVPPRSNEYIPIKNVNKVESISPSSLLNQSKRIVNLPQAKKFLSPVLPTKQTQIAPSTSRVVNQVSALRGVYEQPVVISNKPIHKERSPISNGTNPIDSSDEYLMSCANQPSRSIVLSKSESWHQLALSNSSSRIPRTNDSSPSTLSRASYLPKPPKPRSPSAMKFRTKQYEASSDSVKKMEDKIRRYFDSPNESSTNETKESKKRSSPRHIQGKCMIGLSRSRTLPGICEQKLVLTIPPTQVPLLQVNSADVDKVFDDIFQEATRMDGQHC
ncbi:PREDICTED: uncharacterized protein LOC107072915 [Polistes dominula]|uniref:Uncharacterized protein LOC107072915 n=1 Tax=Polistes dominula TaxID=743375 RepID=A0ABM1J8D3_POLDO|nr:PREDICTED: uncharacterized protein LOC107072915 [Polistes dominula]